jgi:general secretion pathway protein F
LRAADQEPSTGITSRFRSRVPVAELSLFTRRLATLTAASVPLHEALTALHQQERHPELKGVMGRVKTGWLKEPPLPVPWVMSLGHSSENYVAMVAAGEAGGALGQGAAAAG